MHVKNQRHCNFLHVYAKIKDSCLWLKQLWFGWKTQCVSRRVSCIAKGPYTLQLKLQQFCLKDRCENRCPYIKLEKRKNVAVVKKVVAQFHLQCWFAELIHSLMQNVDL